MAKNYAGKSNTIVGTLRTEEVWAEDFNDIATDIESIESDIATLQTDVGTNTSDISALDGRVDILEADVAVLKDKQYIFLVSNSDIDIPDTEVVIMPDVNIGSNGLTYDDTTGILTILKTDVYHTNITASINATATNKTAELWLEIDDNEGSGFVPVPYSGFKRTFPNQNEVEAVYVSSKVLAAGHKYRVKAVSDVSTGINLVTKTLTNAIVMPSIKISISN